MLTVSELSKATHITPDAIRHYVKIGLLVPSRDPSNGYRLFNSDELKKAFFIKRAKGLGFSLSDIRVIFEHRKNQASPCRTVRDMIQKRIVENRRRLSELNRLQQRMDEALEQWRTMPDGRPDTEEICLLIEAIE